MAQLRPNGYNPNRMSPGQFAALKRTIQKDGFVGVVLVRHRSSGYEIIDGEHRWRAAVELKLTHVPCAVANVAEEQSRALTVKLNQIHGNWIPDLLAELVSGLPDPAADLGFAEGELESLLNQFHEVEALDQFNECGDDDRFPISSPKAGERYIGFNLTLSRRKLLDEALQAASSQNRDQANPLAGCLEIILQLFLRDGATTTK